MRFSIQVAWLIVNILVGAEVVYGVCGYLHCGLHQAMMLFMVDAICIVIKGLYVLLV